jgi:hypothetical protein
MVDFRKWFPALAIVALLLGSAVTASAQVGGVTCTVTAGVPPLVRAEGLTELVGDIVLECQGGTPTPLGAQVPLANIQIFLNTNVTSRLIDTSINTMEALLLIDEPTLSTAVACTGAAVCPIVGTGAGGFIDPGTGQAVPGGVSYRTGAVPNTFLGRWGGSGQPNTVSWLGVPIDPPGTTGRRVLRFTNIRGNANALGVSSTLVPSQIVAFVSVTSTQFGALANPQQVVGFVTRGLVSSFRGPTTATTIPAGGGIGSPFLQCTGLNTATAASPTGTLGPITGGGTSVIARFVEGFASSFKRRGVLPGDFSGGGATPPSGYSANVSPTPAPQATPGQNVFTESGFYFGPSSTLDVGGRSPGLADHGTRLMIRVANVPTGVVLFGGLYEVGRDASNSRVRLVTTDASGAGAFSPTSDVGGGNTPDFASFGISGGAGTLVYEVMSSDPNAVETIDIPVFVAFASNAAGLGTATGTLSFAPISTVGTATTGPIPRFVETATPTNIFVINPCRTNLLFPFVTNQSGFDTGIAISNTSLSTGAGFDTVGQSGPCRINYYGGTPNGGAAPPAQTTTSSIPAGGQVTFVVSSGGTNGIVGTPGFQGYIIAGCDFQYAHGFAFISDGPIGSARVAEGYLALVMDAALPSRTGFTSESLGN